MANKITKLALIGQGRSGKGTFSKVAYEYKGITSIASSRMAAELFLFEQLKDEYGYQTIEQCYHDRHNHRQVWYEAIKAFNKEDRSRLGKAIFKRYDIYDGCRDKEEFLSLKKGKHFDLSIWIDAGDRIEPESRNSMSISMEDADIVIKNDGDESQYKERVKRFLDFVG